MRKDIAKVICERPRYHDRSFRNRFRKKNTKPVRKIKLEITDDILDEVKSPSREPISKFAKDFADLLAPLKGWARKQVGKPYSKVISEALALLKGNGVSQQHVRGHIKDFIIPPNDIRIDGNGKPHLKGVLEHVPIYWDQLYADPIDGIIKWGKTKGRIKTGLR